MDDDFLEFCREFIKSPSLMKYTRITLRHGLQKLMDFLADTPRYALYKNNLKMTQLTVEMVAAYVEYLKENSTGDGPKIYFRIFKRMVTAAVDKDLIKKNPCRGFVLKNDNVTLQKEILLPEEINRLPSTHFKGEKPEMLSKGANIKTLSSLLGHTSVRMTERYLHVWIASNILGALLHLTLQNNKKMESPPKTQMEFNSFIYKGALSNYQQGLLGLCNHESPLRGFTSGNPYQPLVGVGAIPGSEQTFYMGLSGRCQLGFNGYSQL